MAHKYFSDKELGEKELNSEEISEDVWNGIFAIYQKFVSNCSLGENFPVECLDGSDICGCNTTQLEDVLKSEIPEFNLPLRKSYDNENLPNKYAILDLIEFLYKNITDPTNTGYHSYYRHNHYSFLNDGVFRSKFRENINTIFSRNGIVFFIDNDGVVKRSIPQHLSKIITEIRFITGDERLNELLEIAYSKFILPRIDGRIESLEKIWDSFERMKTYFEENKKVSANKVTNLVSNDNPLFNEHLTIEFQELTKIGNQFQIRHFEKGKIQITSNLHIDYLFYRMASLIHLCVESFKKL